MYRVVLTVLKGAVPSSPFHRVHQADIPLLSRPRGGPQHSRSSTPDAGRLVLQACKPKVSNHLIGVLNYTNHPQVAISRCRRRAASYQRLGRHCRLDSRHKPRAQSCNTAVLCPGTRVGAVDEARYPGGDEVSIAHYNYYTICVLTFVRQSVYDSNPVTRRPINIGQRRVRWAAHLCMAVTVRLGRQAWRVWV